MRLPKGTTIAVTDGRRLRLFRNEGDGSRLTLTELPAPPVEGSLPSAPRHGHTGQDSRDRQRLRRLLRRSRLA